MITDVNFRQWSWPFFVFLFLALAFWFTNGVAGAEEPGNLSSPSESTVQQTEDKATNTSSKADGDALLKQAVGLEQQGKHEEAIQHYLKAIEISPQNVLAHNNLAWLLATCPTDRLRNGRLAVAHAVRACKITKGRNLSTLDTLSIALAEAGQFQKAIELLTQVRSKVPEGKRKKIDDRLAIFQAGKTYHQAKSGSSSPTAQSPTTESSGTKMKADLELVTLLKKAVTLERAGRLAEAATQYGKVVDRAKKVLGPNHLATAQLMVRQGDKYYSASQFDKALPIFKEALPILRSHLPKNHGAVTYCVNQVAASYNKTGQHEKALRLDYENLAVREASLGKDHLHVLLSLSNIASAHISLFQYEEALRALNKWLERNERGQGEKHPDLPMILSLLGTAHSSFHNPIEAEKCFTRALALHKAQGSTNRLQEAAILGNLATLRYLTARSNKFEEARQFALRALEITTEVCGKNNVKTANAKRVLACVYKRAKKFTEAEPLLHDAVQIEENVRGKDSFPATFFRMELARLYLEVGRADEAEKLCLHCIDIMESQYGVQADFADFAGSLKLLAEIAGRTEHQSQAELRLKRLVHVIENRLDKEHPLLAKVLMQAGEAYLVFGSNDEAKASYKRCLEIQQAKLGPDHPDVAMTLQRLGGLCLRAARYAEAEPFFNESLRIYRTRFGNKHWLVASVLCDIGFLYMRTGRCAEAEKNFEEIVRIAKDSPRVTSAGTLQVTISNWGRLCNKMGRLTKAELLHKQALSMAEELQGSQCPSVAWECVYLAQLYWNRKQYPDAERLFREAIVIFESTKGKGHPDTHVALSGLGGIFCEMGRYEEAEPILRQSLALERPGWKMNERDRFCILERLGTLHWKCGHSKEAIRCGMETQRAHRSVINHVLPGLSPAEQIAYLSSNWRKSFAGWLSVGLNLAKQEEEAVSASAEWLLNGKSLSTELLAEQVRLTRQSNDPALAATVRELAEVRGQLAHLVLSQDQQSDGAEVAKAGDELSRRELELARRLGQQTLSVVRESPWVTLDEVRKNLPAQSVLIEIAKFPVYHLKKGSNAGAWDRPRYVAWVIPPEDAGNVTMVDLGDSERIDEAIARCRQSVELFSEAIRAVGLEQATKIAMVDTARLSALVWQPLAKFTKDAKSLIISPDGGLWLYPWEAMTDAKGNFLVEKKQISYLVTGRQLAFRNKRKVGTAVAIFADPDYDADLFGSGSAQPDIWADLSRLLLGAEAREDKVERLPGAAAEVDAFAAALRRYVNAEPNIYRGRKASEGEFKKLQSPRVLVISTHGYFSPDQALDKMPLTEEAKRIWARYNAARVFGADKTNKPLVVINPLLRCGLALAGVNQRYHATGANDGVLTGLEILGTDFSGTELVVLSACETGVGAVRNAEGIAGLRHAFQLAGAENVIATSWSVLAKPSTELMQTFFDNLVKKQGKAEALHNAQISLIKRMRKATGSAHPALWAGYTIIGGEQ